MTALQPKVDFGTMSDKDIADRGLNAARASFAAAVEQGLLNNDSLAVMVGEIVNGKWAELGSCLLGPDAAGFLPNIDPVSGKIATVVKYGVSSGDAHFMYGEEIPEGPQRWTGGVCFEACVQTVENSWMTRVFAGAASGVQGHFDQATVYAALATMAACWAQKMQALYGKP